MHVTEYCSEANASDRRKILPTRHEADIRNKTAESSSVDVGMWG